MLIYTHDVPCQGRRTLRERSVRVVLVRKNSKLPTGSPGVLSRYIYSDIQDFKNFGGGVPGYFLLLTYYGLSVLAITILQSVFHIYCLHVACDIIGTTDSACLPMFKVFRILPASSTITVLRKHDH